MWDNREGKRNPKAPDFKCRDKQCDGVIWPPRGVGAPAGASSGAAAASAEPRPIVPPKEGEPACPICGGAMWDDRATRRNPRAPDFKCRNRPRERGGPGCEGVIWPPRDGSPGQYGAAKTTSAPGRAPTPRSRAATPPPPPRDDTPPHDDDDLPF